MKSCCEYHRVECSQGDRCPARKPKNLSRNQIRIAAFLTFFFLAYGLVGNMDYEDEVAAQAHAKPTQTAQGGETK